MKSYKLLLLSSAFAMSVSGFGSDAFAFGDLTVFVDKDKDVFVDLDIDKDKDIDIIVDSDLDLDGAAESDVVINQENEFNLVDTTRGDDNPGSVPVFNAGDGIRISAVINNSLNDNTGIIQVNQDVGWMTNQGNVAAVAVVNSVGGSDFAGAQESVQQENDFNQVFSVGGLGIDRFDGGDVDLGQDAIITDPDREARITNSINDNAGIVHANQNAGAMNNQLNDVSIAIADESAVVALAEADLGQFNTFNSVEETNTVKVDLISNAIKNNSGIVNVNQTTGNMNNQATTISFAGLASIQ